MSDKPDARQIQNGTEIPSEGYCDQPYIVLTDDGHWLCTMTTGHGEEGEPGQHIITFRSGDQGKTWKDKADVEPNKGPEASYSVLFKAKSGRIYCFYNYNTERVKEVKREDEGVFKRVDSLGDYVFKYSDDHGKTWSAKRHIVPVREFECDRNNVYGGKLRFFWNVGRPIVTKKNESILVLHKVGAMGKGFFAQSEGAFLKSPNLYTENDPEKITFETLPDGDVGLRTPKGGGRISEEQTIVELSDGSLFSIYRTIDGYPSTSYSRDGGHHWSPPAYASYSPEGKKIKNPRAANFVWKCKNGKYLYWFHNHGGEKFIRNQEEWRPYAERNPAWLAGGVEKNGFIHWSQPEILLYDNDDIFTRMSYPDLVEDGGNYFVTETQKTIARTHSVDASLLEGMWAQFDSKASSVTDAIILSIDSVVDSPRTVDTPHLPRFLRSPQTWYPQPEGTGIAVEMRVTFDDLEPGQTLVDNRDESGKGMVLVTTDRASVRLHLNDGRTESSWECDPKLLIPGKSHHLAVVVDARAKIIFFVIDGVLCDGGEDRQYGWGRMNKNLLDVNAGRLRLAHAFRGEMASFRIHGRALRVSECVGNFKAGVAAPTGEKILAGKI